MSKHIVSGAVALLMVFVPVSTSALSQIYIPQVPQNPTVEQLQSLIVQLTALLQQLILNHTSLQPTPPLLCPVYNAPICAVGEHLVGGDILPNGCQAGPRCETDTTTSSITVTSAVGPLDSDQHYIVNATYTNIPPSTVDLVKNDGLGTDVQTFMPINSSRGWDAFFIRPGVPAGQYFLRVHETATGRVVAESAAFYIAGGATSPSGQLGVSTDVSSPSLAIVAGGSTGVTLGVYNLRATGESININKLNTFLSTDNGGSGNPANIQQLYVYSGATLIGTGFFAGLGQNSTITLHTPFSIARDTDARITIKADLARIGTGQPGVAGSLLKLQLASAEGTGVSSGSYIGGNNNESFGKSSTSGVAGVRIMRSYPTVSLDMLSTTGIADGKLMRFRITANSSGNIAVAKLSVRVAAANATVSTVILNPFTDSNYSVFAPLPGAPTGIGSTGYNEGNGVVRYEFNLPAGLQIAAGQTLYFEVRGTTVVQGSVSSVTTTLLSDSSASALFANSPGNFNNFIWSPNSYTTAQFSTSDWVNGHAVPGLPSIGLVQSRFDSGQTQPQGNPRITYTSHGNGTINASYNDMPSNTQVVIINQTSGARIDSVSTYIQNGGSGSISIPFPPNTPAGTYYLKAMNYNTQAYIAQTVSFSYAGTPSAVVSVTGSASAASYRNGIDQVRFSYDVNNAPAGAYIQIDLKAAKMIGGRYPIVSPYRLDGTTRTFDLSQAQQTFPSHGTLTMSLGTSESNIPIDGPLQIKIMDVNGNQIAYTEIPMRIVTGTTPACTAPSITMPSVGYSLIISQPGQGQAIAASGGATISINTAYPWVTFSGSTLTFTSIPVAGTYPVTFTATNTCGSVSQSFNVIVETNTTSVPTADIKANGSNGPITIAYGATATISWSSSNVSSCGIIPSAQAYWVGNYGTSGSKDSGSLTQSNTYTLQCNGNNGKIVTDTVTVNVSSPIPVACPLYMAPACPVGQRLVIDPVTYDASKCEVPHSHCVADQVSCTYTPVSSKLGDKASYGVSLTPSTINIEGGQSACSSWCSSQGAEAYMNYSCSYNGTAIAMTKPQLINVASALTALEMALRSLIAQLGW